MIPGEIFPAEGEITLNGPTEIAAPVKWGEYELAVESTAGAAASTTFSAGWFAAADVSDAQQVKAAVAAVEEAFGHITVLMNHAGILSAMPFLETSEEEWDRIMAVNVKSMFLVTKAVLPGMLSAGGGSIVCTSSISAVVGTPMEVLYCTSKGALIAGTSSARGWRP